MRYLGGSFTVMMGASDEYRANWDRVFGPEKRAEPPSPIADVLEFEFLRPLGMTRAALAVQMFVDEQIVYDLLDSRSGVPVTPDIAARLARVLGTTAEFWLNIQAAHDAVVSGVA